jgi:pyruvate/2-oxoglutarate dehydrogenase complex dihydrolipoamide acyltransferase (E2) component
VHGVGSRTSKKVMAIVIRIPKLGMEMTEGTLAAWLVADGTAVDQDQPIYELETDKVSTEITAPIAGILRHGGVVGQTYPVGDVIGELA